MVWAYISIIQKSIDDPGFGLDIPANITRGEDYIEELFKMKAICLQHSLWARVSFRILTMVPFSAQYFSLACFFSYMVWRNLDYEGIYICKFGTAKTIIFHIAYHRWRTNGVFTLIYLYASLRNICISPTAKKSCYAKNYESLTFKEYQTQQGIYYRRNYFFRKFIVKRNFNLLAPLIFNSCIFNAKYVPKSYAPDFANTEKPFWVTWISTLSDINFFLTDF